MTYEQFKKELIEDEQYLDEETRYYSLKHARRLYYTLNECKRLIKKGDKILSIGSYHSPLEKMLKKIYPDNEISIAEYPEVIDKYINYYNFLGLKTYKADLSKKELDLPKNYFDIVIYTEVIEHISKTPYEQLFPIDQLLKKGGKIIITTPNLGSVVHIAKLFMNIPLQDDPELFFSPVNKDTLQVHRREYMPNEIKDDLKKLGYITLHKYFIYNEPKSIQYRMMYMIGNAIPRFREGMLIIGKKM